MTKKQHILIAFLVGILALLVLFNSNIIFFRVDLTEKGLHSLSSESIKILDQLEDELQITYYRSENLLNFASFPLDIQDVLLSYNSHPAVTIHIEDPVQTDREDFVLAKGFKRQQFPFTDYDLTENVYAFSGLQISYKDQSMILPIVEHTHGLEYYISSKVLRMIQGERPKIGYYVAGGGQSYQSSYVSFRHVINQIGEPFELTSGDYIPEDLDVLIVSSSVIYNQTDIEAIDTYTSNGGASIFLVDPVSVIVDENFKVYTGGNGYLWSLLRHYGIYPEPVLLGDTYSKTIPIYYEDENGQYSEEHPYYHWPLIHQNYINYDHPAMIGFAGLELYWPSPLVLRADAQVMLASTENSWLMAPGTSVEPRVENPQTPYGEPIPLAASYSGPIESYFPSSIAGEGRFIVVGDSDFISDLTSFDEGAYNFIFLMNCIEWSMNDDDLLAIRSKGFRDTSLNKLQREGKIEVFNTVAWFSTVILPIIIALIGIRLRKGKKV